MRYVADELLHGQYRRVGRARSLSVIQSRLQRVPIGVSVWYLRRNCSLPTRKRFYSVAQNPESIMESACAVAVAPPRCPCNSRDQKDSDLSSTLASAGLLKFSVKMPGLHSS